MSTDLVHWKQLPLAIPQDANEMVWSGSAVFDKNNSSGFGTRDTPPLVAIYTSAQKKPPFYEGQALAYSTDGGMTWTKYAGNPVLNINSQNFRDPKVFWYAPSNRWVMAVARQDVRQVQFYSSPDLKHWTYLSSFGPAGAIGGAWECPDVFPLQMDENGDLRRLDDDRGSKWVLVVNLDPGAIAGDLGTQYFVGQFDGTRFVSDEPVSYTPPAGGAFNDFEGQTYGAGWTTTGTAFGSGPAQGTLPGQQTVSGYLGHGLVNSFLGGDGLTGPLTSPTFSISSKYIDFLIGGGDYPMSAPNPTAVNLLVNGQVVRTATGQNDEALNWVSWDVSQYQGQRATIQIVDDNSGGWWHINADEFVISDQPGPGSPSPALPR